MQTAARIRSVDPALADRYIKCALNKDIDFHFGWHDIGRVSFLACDVLTTDDSDDVRIIARIDAELLLDQKQIERLVEQRAAQIKVPDDLSQLDPL